MLSPPMTSKSCSNRIPSLVSVKRSSISACPRRRKCALAQRVNVFFCTATQSLRVLASTWVWRCRSPQGVEPEEEEEGEEVAAEAEVVEEERVEEGEEAGERKEEEDKEEDMMTACACVVKEWGGGGMMRGRQRVMLCVDQGARPEVA